MATTKKRAAKRRKQGPKWAAKKRQIEAALKRIAVASAALEAARRKLVEVIATDPGTGPNPWN